MLKSGNVGNLANNNLVIGKQRLQAIKQALNIFIVWIVLVLSYTACQTYITITPVISGNFRSGLNLSQPIIIAIQDERNTTKNNYQTVESIQSGLKSIYGDNIVFKPYFEKVTDNSVAIKIKIKEIGAKFGIRTIRYQTHHNQITAVAGSISTYWGSAVSSAIISQPIVKDNYAIDGYWIGTSLLNITLVDNLHPQKNIHEFPFAAENVQGNILGYMTAKIVAEQSWRTVSSHLLDLIDSIALKISENN
jgi:hypothetical protein